MRFDFFEYLSKRHWVLTGIQDQDLCEFLETQVNRTRKRRRLFWSMFSLISSTLGTIRNKVVMEKLFLWHAYDSVFNLLALCVDNGTRSGWMAHRFSASSSR
jgi:hypothetical protein